MKDKRSRLRDARKLSSQPENADKKLWKTVFQDDTRLYYLPFGSTSVRPEQTLVGVVLLPKPRTRIVLTLVSPTRDVMNEQAPPDEPNMLIINMNIMAEANRS